MFRGCTLAIATKHEKEKVLAPLFEKAWGVRCIVPPEFDTDVFGMFNGQIEREGPPLDAARKKCALAAQLTGANLVIASEGSFGPHPSIPFVPANEELLLLTDFVTGREFVVMEFTTETNFDGGDFSSWDELKRFATRVGFPTHALILRVGKNDYTFQYKAVRDWSLLEISYQKIVSLARSVYVETDMRACYNPTRMAAIERAGHKMIELLQSHCPQCAAAGFSVTAVERGLPCECCGQITEGVLAHRYECQLCGFEKMEWFPNGKSNELAMYCNECNP